MFSLKNLQWLISAEIGNLTELNKMQSCMDIKCKVAGCLHVHVLASGTDRWFRLWRGLWNHGTHDRLAICMSPTACFSRYDLYFTPIETCNLNKNYDVMDV